MNKIKPEKYVWIIVKDNEVMLNDWQDSEKEAIDQHIVMNGKDWNFWKSLGYRCIQVNINFEEVKN